MWEISSGGESGRVDGTEGEVSSLNAAEGGAENRGTVETEAVGCGVSGRSGRAVDLEGRAEGEGS